MTCTYIWNGQIYYGAKAVAEAAGVSTKTVSSHLERQGNLDTLGIGRGRIPPRNLVWQGKTYTSVKDIAKAAGVSQGYVYRLLSKHGGLERLGAGRWQAKSPATATPKPPNRKAWHQRTKIGEPTARARPHVRSVPMTLTLQ